MFSTTETNGEYHSGEAPNVNVLLLHPSLYDVMDTPNANYHGSERVSVFVCVAKILEVVTFNRASEIFIYFLSRPLVGLKGSHMTDRCMAKLSFKPYTACLP